MTVLELSADRLRDHPAINPELFLEPTRACLKEFHEPSRTRLTIDREDEEETAVIEWDAPLASTSTSMQREDLVELGAVGMACLLLSQWSELRITDVAQRGHGPDYWLGKEQGDHDLYLEVSGTDRQDLSARAEQKLRQLRRNPYRKGGYVAVSRFIEPRAYFKYHPPE